MQSGGALYAGNRVVHLCRFPAEPPPARPIGVPPSRINEIVLGKRSITADTTLRLAETFGTSEGFWLGLQADYDVEEARKITYARVMAVVSQFKGKLERRQPKDHKRAWR